VSITSPARNKNPSKSPRFAVEDFRKSGFGFSHGKNAANTAVLASILTKEEQKSAFLKRGSDLIAHP